MGAASERPVSVLGEGSLLGAIRAAQRAFIEGVPAREIFGDLIDAFVEISGSEYGFLCSVERDGDGPPRQRHLAMSRAVRESAALSASVERGERPSGGAFLEMPLRFGGELVGVAGLANRAGGYDRALVEELEPLAATCASIINAVKQTERQAALEAALVESERKYRTIADNTYDWEFWLGPDGRFLYCSPSSARVVGWEASRFLEDPAFLGSLVHPDDRALYDAHIHEAEAASDPRKMDFRLRAPDGSYRWIGHVCGPVWGADGAFLGTRGSNREVTGRRRELEQLEEANRKLDALWRIASLSEATSKEICDHILESIVRMTGSRFGFYGFIDPDETEMTIYSWSGGAMASCAMVDKPAVFAVSEAGVWAEAIRSRTPLILNDYAAPHGAKRGLPVGHVPLENLLVVPVFAGARIVSVAAVANRPAPYGEADAREVAAFVGSVQLVATHHRDEERVERERESFQRVFRAVPVGLLLLDAETTVREANPAAGLLVLREPTEMIGRRAGNAIACVHGDEHPGGCGFGNACPECPLRASIERALATGASVSGLEIEVTLLVGGSLEARWVSVNAEPLEIDGRPHIVVAIDDVTDRRRAAREIERLHESLSQALEAADAGAWDWDVARNAFHWSDELYRVFGIDPALPAGFEAWRGALHPEDLEAAERRIAEAIERRTDLASDYRVVRPGGEVRWIRSLGRTQYGGDGRPVRMSGICVDVTERKKVDVAAREQLEELQRWHDVMLDREDRVQELKREVNELLGRLGEGPRYGGPESGGDGGAP